MGYEETGKIQHLSVYLPIAQFKELIRVCLPCGDGCGGVIRDQIENKPKEMFPKKPSHLTSNMSMTNQVHTVNVSSLRTSPVIVSACEGISQSVAM